MLFRPEEIDAASGGRPVVHPLAYADTGITAYFSRIEALYDAVPQHDAYVLTAIEAGRIDLDRLARKCPADRQGIKSSWRIPLLLTINRYAVLGGQVAERGKCYDVVCIWMQPCGTQSEVHQLTEQLFSFIGRHREFLGDLGVVWRNSLLYNGFHDKMMGMVELFHISHISSFFEISCFILSLTVMYAAG